MKIMKITNRILARSKQRGLGLLSLAVGMAVLGVVGLTAMRAFPAFTEHSAIKKAVAQIEASGATDPTEVRKKFDDRAALEYITTLGGRDLKITKTGRGVKIDYEYEKRIPLVSNAFLVFEFSSAN